jgi:hypothetical protein
LPATAQQQQQQRWQQQDADASSVLPAVLPASFRELLTQYDQLQQQLHDAFQGSQSVQQQQPRLGELAEMQRNTWWLRAFACWKAGWVSAGLAVQATEHSCWL